MNTSYWEIIKYWIKTNWINIKWFIDFLKLHSPPVYNMRVRTGTKIERQTAETSLLRRWIIMIIIMCIDTCNLFYLSRYVTNETATGNAACSSAAIRCKITTHAYSLYTVYFTLKHFINKNVRWLQCCKYTG